MKAKSDILVAIVFFLLFTYVIQTNIYAFFKK